MVGIEGVISKIEGISLEEMDAVKLMNRTDRKYWFHRSQLVEILSEVVGDYYILEVAGERNMPYSTLYYDTPQDEMYINHHRGKGNRYKIRRRNYVSTKSSFLEVKFKSNKGRTVKVRRASAYDIAGFSSEDEQFIGENTPYQSSSLERALQSDFNRLMLVSREMNERCTIDSSLQFRSGDSQRDMDDLVIVEVKSDGRSHSSIIDAMGRRRIKPSGFSKYCIGRSLTDEALKQNNFKEKHRAIDKVVNNVF